MPDDKKSKNDPPPPKKEKCKDLADEYQKKINEPGKASPVTASDPCEKLAPKKGLENLFKKKVPPPTCAKKSEKKSIDLKKFPGSVKGLKDLKNLIPEISVKDLKNRIPPLPEINLNELKNIEYRKWIKYGFCRLKIWVKENCDPKKMADKGSGPPARPMKYPYTFSAKFAQFPIGHYVKNQWIWKYYIVAFAACVPIFYSINKLANSPGNVAKWAEIRRKEAAEHHH